LRHDQLDLHLAATRRQLELRRLRRHGDRHVGKRIVGPADVSDDTGASMTAYANIIVETRERVGLITLNRPQRMNALNDELARELEQALCAFDADPGVAAIVITGNEKAFAAGADIGRMADMRYEEAYGGNFISRSWESVRHTRKPVIAAVAGYALGGGCE